MAHDRVIQRLNGFGIPRDRVCTTCGEPITGAEWLKMELLDFQIVPAYEDDPGMVLELKNHTCGSTLAELAPFTATTFERGVAEELPKAANLKLARSIAAGHLDQDPLYYGVD